jgi:hypothetical protein
VRVGFVCPTPAQFLREELENGRWKQTDRGDTGFDLRSVRIRFVARRIDTGTACSKMSSVSNCQLQLNDIIAIR